MALLPLAGWAQIDISDGWSISLSTPTATYDGTSLTPAVTLTHATNPKSPLPSSKFNVEWFKDGVSLGATPELKDVNETGYEVKVTADITNTYGDLAVNTKKFWILKANSALNNVPATWGGGAYDGNAHALVTTAPTFNFGTPLYSLDETSWSADIPTATKVGDYDVYYKVEGTTNYNGIAKTKLGTVTITGNAIPVGEYTLPTVLATNINFDNTAHNLANAGSATGAHCAGLKYSIDGTNWSDAVPQATNVGDYTVYYKVVAVEGYYDVVGNFAAHIVAAAPTVTSATAQTATITYNGLGQSLLKAAGTATIGATPKYTIQYKAAEADAWGAEGALVAYADVKGTNAGFYRINTKVEAGGNYLAAVAPTTTEVEIKKAVLTVTTDAKEKVYGEADPTLTATYTGFQNGETTATAAGFSAATLNRAAGENVGSYLITATANAAANNYTFTYDTENDGSLVITQRELAADGDFVFTLTDASKVYSGSALLTTIATATFKTDPMVSPADYTYVTTNNVNVGVANVIISGQGNFKGSIIKTFNITPKPVFIQPNNASKSYSAADPDPLTTFKLVAAPGGATIAGATLNGNVTFARVAGENVASYKIYVKAFTPTPGAPTGNFTISPAQIINDPENGSPNNLTATFQINPNGDGLVLKFKDDIDAAKKTKVYGEANPAWTLDDLEVVSGLVGEDTWEGDVKPALSAGTWAISSENVNDNNQVVVTDLASTNYPYVTVQPMDFTVTARPIEVTMVDQAIDFGNDLEQANPTYWSVTDGSFGFGDDADDLGLTVKTVNALYSYAVADDAYADAITAEITNTNYALTVVKAALTVNAGASITLSRTEGVDNLIKGYDGKNITTILDRNITRTEAWFAMVLPFETTVTELSQKYGYAVVNVLDETNTDASKVKFKLYMQTIAANQPFLIKIATAKETPMDFGLKEIIYDNDPVRTDAAGNEFHGLFKTTELTASDYLWTMVPASNSFKKLDTKGTTLSPISAYLKTKENLDAFAPVITIEDFDFNTGTTSIKALNLENMKAYSVDGWYNMNGVKLQGVPTEKGVYINNGKKVVVK